MASRAVEFTDSWVLVADDPADNVDVEVLLRYEDCEPFEVQMMYESYDSWVLAATFSRDLLGAGLGVHAGAGEVQVWPSPDLYRLYVVVSDPTGEWCYLAPRQHVQDFIAESLRLVPRGQESFHLAVPDDVGELLEGSDDE